MQRDMNRKYKFRNPESIYFVSFATVNWINVFTRPEYKDSAVDYAGGKGILDVVVV